MLGALRPGPDPGVGGGTADAPCRKRTQTWAWQTCAGPFCRLTSAGRGPASLAGIAKSLTDSGAVEAHIKVRHGEHARTRAAVLVGFGGVWRGRAPRSWCQIGGKRRAASSAGPQAMLPLRRDHATSKTRAQIPNELFAAFPVPDEAGQRQLANVASVNTIDAQCVFGSRERGKHGCKSRACTQACRTHADNPHSHPPTHIHAAPVWRAPSN